MSLRYFWLGVIWCSLSLGNSLTLDSRFEYQNVQNDLGVFSATYQPAPRWGLEFETSGRFSLSKKDLENWSYSLGTVLPLFSFVSTSMRLSQENWLGSSTAVSTLLFLLQFQSRPLSSIRLFLQGGWYRRFVTLNNAHFLPGFWGSNYSEHDFAVALGTEIRWSPSLTSQAKVATLEEISVFNLNNPFIEAAVAYWPTESISWSLYSRYHLLLGFGRMDSLKVGLALKMPLS